MFNVTAGRGAVQSAKAMFHSGRKKTQATAGRRTLKRPLASLTCLVGLGIFGAGFSIAHAQDLAVSEQQDGGLSWAIACQAVEPGRTSCSVFQRQVTSQGQSIIALEVVGLERDATPQLLITVPLGVDVREPVVLSSSNEQIASLDLVRCTQAGCSIDPGPSAIIEAMMQVEEMTVSFGAFGDSGTGTAQMIVPMDGFANAVERIRASD